MVSRTGHKKAGLGFGTQFALVTAVAVALLAWSASRVGDVVSLWLTPDQQAHRQRFRLLSRVSGGSDQSVAPHIGFAEVMQQRGLIGDDQIARCICGLHVGGDLLPGDNIFWI